MNIDNKYFYPTRYSKYRSFPNSLYNQTSNLLGKDESKLSKIVEMELDKVFNEQLMQNTLTEESLIQAKWDDEFNSFKLFLLWRYYGKNIFHFSKQVLELLQKTDVNDVKKKHLKYPFVNFYVSVRELNLPIEDPYSKAKCILDGAYFEFIEDSAGKLFLKITICGYDSDSNEKNWFHSPEFRLTLALPFNSNESTVQDAFDYLDELNKKSKELDYEHDTGNVLLGKEFLRQYIKLFINCICYLSSKEPDIENSFTGDVPSHLISLLNRAKNQTEKQSAENRILKSGFTKIKFVGKSFEESKPVTNLTEVSTHWRRGHWRNQVYGENNSKQKLIWILPTIVRKDRGLPEVGHIYEI